MPRLTTGPSFRNEAAAVRGAIRSVIVAEKSVLREEIARLLGDEPDVEMLDPCDGRHAAAELLRLPAVDLLLLEVREPFNTTLRAFCERDGDASPFLIVVSPRADVAAAAFEAGAVDFLLQPLRTERFRRALQRVRVRLREGIAELRAIGHAEPAFPSAPSPHYPDFIALKRTNRFVVIAVDQIDGATAAGNYARLHVGQQAHVVSRTLIDLQKRVLPPASFLRIHRSAIVNTQRVVGIERLPAGQLLVELQGGSKHVCSRRYQPALRQRIAMIT